MSVKELAVTPVHKASGKHQSATKSKHTEGKKGGKSSSNKKKSTTKVELPESIQKIKQKIQTKIDK